MIASISGMTLLQSRNTSGVQALWSSSVAGLSRATAGSRVRESMVANAMKAIALEPVL